MPENAYRQRSTEVVLQRFKSMIKEVQSDPGVSDFMLAAIRLGIAPHENNYKKRVLKKLVSSLLPLLRQQIIKIYVSPVQINLPEDPGPMIEGIIECQSMLDHIWIQILFAIHILWPQSTAVPFYQEGDGHLAELKYYRLHGLFEILNYELSEAMLQFLECTMQTLQRLGLIDCKDRSGHNFPGGDEAFTKEGSLEIRDSALGLIDRMIKQSEGSELDLIGPDFLRMMRCSDSGTEKLTELIEQGTTYQQGVTNRITEPLGTTHTHGSIQVYKSLLLLSRMARIFVKKLSKRGMNTDQLPFFTKLCSSQMQYLSNSLSRVHMDLLNIRPNVTGEDPFGSRDHDALPRRIKRLREFLESDVVDISHHFRPLATDTDDFPTQTYFDTWFSIWSTHFDLAICNLEEAVKTLDS
ncbi:hypothetical protein MJO28_016354 [Puccinia striiformis f. sp. tritici]|uniref:Uncharacterized protein n=2 Tax=Puccinia striiformis f. sp. tritici TaxID=168172 RepID=A0A0L0VZ90_9BASI|nr:hypothetical protein Pst134EA_030519 [Puccinia striiformis f. sp. tritici]KAH9440448.1 hypothetical protein Pst134EB_031060 [Puccinia striiformis f. sp. tritici]KAH9446608.1 hypothetical protein Pst134EA_030519 [Puccinia striiformis f. sp. tritici]KAI7935483.1 hypothetical protein MJO28_016354 [Puccinia striiformis f. sp. tritici]KNF04614.1 hypothetical protein PSTG_02103 [Puccinia striiformis f. sp. tritici PST-78]